MTDDIVGIETAVALKNACAMAVSLAIGVYTENDPSRPEKYNAQSGLFYEAARFGRNVMIGFPSEILLLRISAS